MVKALKKPKKSPTNPLLSNLELHSNTINSIKKSKQEINKEHYQKHKEKLKSQRRNKYQLEKEQAQQSHSKYSQTSNYRILISLKEYTELNQAKRKRWLDFRWVLQDLANVGVYDIAEVMRLRELADLLIADYWTTAKNEIGKGKSWNNLSEEEKDRLIRYWANEKTRIESGFLDTAEQLEKQSQEYLKEIELAKFHEERGKIKCFCYDCEGRKEVRSKIVKEWKELESKKGECFVCGKSKKLDEETGACRKVFREFLGSWLINN